MNYRAIGRICKWKGVMWGIIVKERLLHAILLYLKMAESLQIHSLHASVGFSFSNWAFTAALR